MDVIKRSIIPIDADYFNKELLFLNIDDFFINRQAIKAVFNELGIDDIYYYRLYVYSRPFVADMWKDRIWDYLMNDMNDIDFEATYMIYKKKPIL